MSDSHVPDEGEQDGADADEVIEPEVLVAKKGEDPESNPDD